MTVAAEKLNFLSPSPIIACAVCAVATVLALGGCSSEVATRLTDEQANRIVVALNENGIAASKRREGASGPRALYRVEVAGADLGRALSVLQAGGLPGRSDPGWEQILERPGLVPTAGEERARLAAAMSGELARTIEAVDGVVDARVHLSPPDDRKKGLDAPRARSGASVMVKYRTPSPPIGEAAIRELVAGAVPAVSREEVVVVMLRAEPLQGGAPRLVRIGPIAVTANSTRAFKALLGGSLLLIAVLSATVIWLLSRLRKASSPEPGAKEP